METHPKEPDLFPHDERICQIVEWLADQNKKEDYFDLLLVELAEDDSVYKFCRLLATLESKNSIIIKGITNDTDRN